MKNNSGLNDLPTIEDSLDFKPYVETLLDVIKTAKTPLSIGVFGDWGYGKTSLLLMLKSKLPKTYPRIWFDAWKFNNHKDLSRSLLLLALESLRESIPQKAAQDLQEIEDLQAALYEAVDREEIGKLEIDGEKLAKGVLKGGLRIGLSFLPGISTMAKMVEELQKEAGTGATDDLFDAIRRERSSVHINKIKFIEQFQNTFSQLVKKHVLAKKRRLVVFVDDLDRCLPDQAVEVLEAIKLFLDVPGCIFLLALDQDVVATGIEIKYREYRLPMDEEGKPKFNINGRKYLEKLIQLPFQIPRIERQDMDSFVSGLVDNWPHNDCPRVFAIGLGDNPRQVKRTVNLFFLLWGLSRRRARSLSPVRLAKVVAIQQIDFDLYNLLKLTPRLLKELEDYYRQNVEYLREESLGLSEKNIDSPVVPPTLEPYVGNHAIERVLLMHTREQDDFNFHMLSTNELQLYFTLARQVEEAIPKDPKSTSRKNEPQLIEIPSGPFIRGASEAEINYMLSNGVAQDVAVACGPQEVVEIEGFLIGRYPVTNREYSIYIEETGYPAPRFWEGGFPPEDKGDHPVVDVSRREAIAYCQWLSEKSGYSYFLPSEEQWEKAARGRDGQWFPWGNEFDYTKCNTAERYRAGEEKSTSAVGAFSPEGDSPYGIADMSGNVWEWTSSHYLTYVDQTPISVSSRQHEHLVHRGGSFRNGAADAMCSTRHFLDSISPRDRVGFRIARLLSSPE